MARFREVLFLGLLGFFWCFTGAQRQLTATIKEGSSVTANRGSNLNLSCQFNEQLSIFLTHHMEWTKESRVPEMTNQTLVLSHQQAILTGNRYKIEFQTLGLLSAVFTIRNVESSDDGRYSCRLVSSGTKVIDAIDSIDVIVPNGAKQLEMAIDKREISSANTKVTPGSRLVQCHSQGGNPADALTVTLDARLLTIQNESSSFMVDQSLQAGAPRYSEFAEAVIDISEADNGTDLTCSAGPGGKVVSTSLIVVDTPTLHCDDANVKPNDTHVQLVCLAQHADVAITADIWDIGDSGIVFASGGSAGNHSSKSQSVSETETQLTMDLEVVSWGEPRTPFNLTLITEIGPLSDTAYLIVESDDDDKDTDTDDTTSGGGEDVTDNGSIAAVFCHDLLLLGLASWLCCQW